MSAVRAAAGAVTFLTSVPLGRVVRVDAGDVARGAWLFPLVGGAVLGIAGLAADVLADRLPVLAAGAIAVAIAALVTGGMHLDALADAADALGARDREHALAIMRDHAVGAFGATALVVVCLLDATLLGSLAGSGDAAVAGLAAGAASRAAALLPARVLRPARGNEGLGGILVGLGTVPVAVALAFAALLALAAGAPGVAGLGAALLAACAVGVVAARLLGGVTGDVLGAALKLGETGALLAAVLVLGS